MNQGEIFDNRYMILALLGAGSFGSVYRAQQIGLERIVALKVLDDVSKAAWLRFEREAKILTKLHHRNLVQVYGFGIAEGKPYMAMEFVNGIDLQSKLDSGALTIEQAISVITQASAGIAYAHAHGVVHRDLKPSNLLLVAEPTEVPESSIQVKVIDFGLAKRLNPEMQVSQHLTAEGFAVGNVLYMSPEQCTAQEIGETADVYALGCILYHCLAGNPPFTANTAFELMALHVSEPMPPLPETVTGPRLPALSNVINKATRKRPSERYASVAAFMEDLSSLSATEQVPCNSQISPAAPFQTKKFKHLNILQIVAIVSVLICIGAIGLRFSEALRDRACTTPDLSGFPSANLASECNYLKGQSADYFDKRYKQLLDSSHKMSSADQTQLQVCYAEHLFNCRKVAESVAFLERTIEQTRNPEDRIVLTMAQSRCCIGDSIRSRAVRRRALKEAEQVPNLAAYTRFQLYEAFIDKRDLRDAQETLTAIKGIKPSSPWYVYLTSTKLARECELAALRGEKVLSKKYALELVRFWDTHPYYRQEAICALLGSDKYKRIETRAPDAASILMDYSTPLLTGRALPPPDANALLAIEPPLFDIAANTWFDQAYMLSVNALHKTQDHGLNALLINILARPDVDYRPEHKAMFQIALGEQYLLSGRYSAGIAVLNQAIKTAHEYKLFHMPELAKSFSILYDNWYLDEALHLSDEFIFESRLSKDPRWIYDAYVAKGEALGAGGDLRGAGRAFAEGLHATEHLERSCYTAWMLFIRNLACSPKSIANKVDQLYELCLGRNHNKTDKEFEQYVRDMQNNTTAQQIAARLFGSKEFGEGKSDRQFVESLFQRVQGDYFDLDTALRARCLKKLERGEPRTAVALTFAESPFFTQCLTSRLYRQVLKRPRHSYETYWSRGAKLRQPLPLMPASFLTSKECRALTKSKPDKLVNLAYEALLGRPPSGSETEYARPMASAFFAEIAREEVMPSNIVRKFY